MKKCSVCGGEFPASTEFFYAREKCRGGLDTRCRVCHKQRLREWRQRTGYYEKNRDKIIATATRWRKENAERSKEYQKNWRSVNYGNARSFKSGKINQ